MDNSTHKHSTDNDGLILLEPDTNESTNAPGESSTYASSNRGDSPSMETENEQLLRSRLRLIAWMFTVVFGVLFLWNLITRETHTWILTSAFSFRILLALGLAYLVSDRFHWSIRQLRVFEGLFFGINILCLLFNQYHSNMQYIGNGQVEKVIATELSGVLLCNFYMMVYGALIPNDPKRTARAVMYMALGPLFVFAILLAEPLERMSDLHGINPLAMAGTSTIYLGLGIFVSIATAFVLHGLRKELHQAKQLGQYQLGERLGDGGMGDVFMAEHQMLKRPCALKLIKPDIANNSVAIARFEREVQSAAMLQHPNTIEIFDYGHSADGTFYYVMEYLPGMNSHDIVAKYGPMPLGRVIYLMKQVCGALAEAHRLGIVHRDLKPANILIAIRGGECDVAKVLDFGLAKLTTPGSTTLTTEYSVSGTPSYMSPEQAMAENNVDGRTDLYALGAILYFWLTGRPPFVGSNPMELMIAHSRDAAAAPSSHRSDIPADLDAIVLKCLAKRPEERFSDARELARALNACSCAGTWTSQDAEDWWAAKAAEHEGELESESPSTHATASATHSSTK